jgi:hypothetical protein
MLIPERIVARAPSSRHGRFEPRVADLSQPAAPSFSKEYDLAPRPVILSEAKHPRSFLSLSQIAIIPHLKMREDAGSSSS